MASISGRHKFYREISKPETHLDMARAALYIAQEVYPNLEPGDYLVQLDRMADEIEVMLPKERYPLRTIRAIDRYLFGKLKFSGNGDNYDSRNSFLNEVLTRRTGIPIALSLVYMELAQRLQFPMVGIGMPGYFLLRPDIEGVEFFVDPFHAGEILFVQDCKERLRSVSAEPVALQPEFLAPVSKRSLLSRLVANLKYIYINSEQYPTALAMVDCLLLLDPDSPQEHRDRGFILYHVGRFQEASQDLEFYLERVPQARDARSIRLLLAQMCGPTLSV